MATKTQTRKQVKQLLFDKFGSDDDRGHVTFSKGLFTVREGYFYRHGRTSEDLAKKVLDLFPEAEVVDHGDHFASFKGGEGVRRNSHFYVQFSV